MSSNFCIVCPEKKIVTSDDLIPGILIHKYIIRKYLSLTVVVSNVPKQDMQPHLQRGNKKLGETQIKMRSQIKT